MAEPMLALIDFVESPEKVLSILVVLVNKFFSFPREVIWYTAPGYSIRNGRAMTAAYQNI